MLGYLRSSFLISASISLPVIGFQWGMGCYGLAGQDREMIADLSKSATGLLAYCTAATWTFDGSGCLGSSGAPVHHAIQSQHGSVPSAWSNDFAPDPSPQIVSTDA